MNLLLLSLLALALGPLLVLLARRHASALVAIDSFCVIAISGFAMLHLLPVSAQQAGWLVFPLALAGFLAPALAERGLHHHGTGLRRTVLVLAMLGIAAHSILDGLALSMGHACMSGEHDHGHDHTSDHVLLAWAVILHRIPEGLGIWWIIPRTLGTAAAVVVTLVSVLTTSFGFFVAPSILTDASTQGLALVQALLAGSLLHVVLHAHVPAPSDRPAGRWHVASVLGAAAAVFVLWRVIHLPSSAHVHTEPGAEAHVHGSSFEVFTALALESAPALLFAYLLVGLSNSFLPKGWLRGISKGSTLTQALKGVAIGLPLPVCSCGVVPLYREMIRQGASMAAAIAFLIATPELEIAAVVLTWQLLGPELAVGRVVMAALLALGVGMLVARLARQASSRPAEEPAPEPAAAEPLGARIVGALRFGFGPAIDNTATWILMGLLLSALLAPYIQQDWISALPPGLDVPIAALLGLPLYVCATGSTPLAAILLAQGVSPGAALALLLTGPATNVTTFGMLGRLHGRRVAVTFAAVMWIGTVLLGYATNALLPAPTRPGFLADHHHGSVLQYASLGVLSLLFAISLLRQGVRPFLERLYESPANLEPGTARDCCAPTEPTIVAPKSCCDHDHGPAGGHSHHHH